MPFTVKGADQLPAGQCVVVSNHASYLDGVVFTAALPAQFSFVIKREMNGVRCQHRSCAVPRLAFRRAGSIEIEARQDARRVHTRRHQRQFARLSFPGRDVYNHPRSAGSFIQGRSPPRSVRDALIVPADRMGTRSRYRRPGGLPSPGAYRRYGLRRSLRRRPPPRTPRSTFATVRGRRSSVSSASPTSHVPAILPPHLIQSMRDLSQRTDLDALHELAEHVATAGRGQL